MKCPQCGYLHNPPRKVEPKWGDFREKLFKLVKENPGKTAKEYLKLYKKKYRGLPKRKYEGYYSSVDETEVMPDSSFIPVFSQLHPDYFRRERGIVKYGQYTNRVTGEVKKYPKYGTYRYYLSETLLTQGEVS